MAIAWSVVGVVCSLLVGVGVNMLSLSPPDFRNARICFWAAFSVLGAMDVYWACQTTWPLPQQLIVTIPVGLVVMIGLPLMLHWVKKREELLLPRAVVATTPVDADLAVSFVQCWVQDDVFYAQVKNNGGSAITDATAEITYHDSKGVPYAVLEGIWRESGENVLSTWNTGALVLAVTTDQETFYAPTKPVYRLGAGKGFIAVHLHATLYGSQPCSLPALFFAVDFDEQLSIRQVTSIPSGERS